MKKGRVLLGMSGGVDSSVSALLLKNEGYEVIGVTLSLSNHTDAKDAKEVCDKLGIEHISIDMQESFKKYVIDNFIDCYANALTPNPCIECNRKLKFGEMYKKAKELNCDFLATGHYAKIEYNDEYNQYVLEKCINTNKDQSYVLYTLPKEILDKVLFPLGDFSSKDEIRQIAKEVGIPVFDKKDSTGICFIGERNFQKFMANYLKPNPGDIINVETGEKIGTHMGLMNYTIGQRKNVGLSGDEQRHYVCGKDTKKNILYVAFGESEYLYSDECTVDNVNFISSKRPSFCTCKFRYRGEDHPCALEYLENNKIRVIYKGKAKSVTPGQACVFYDGEECLGCGFIDEVFKDGEKLWYLN